MELRVLNYYTRVLLEWNSNVTRRAAGSGAIRGAGALLTAPARSWRSVEASRR